jgi:hypothetical protein
MYIIYIIWVVLLSYYYNKASNLTCIFQYLHAVFREDALHRVKDDTDILLTITRSKANWIGNILHRIWRKKGMRRRGRRCTQLLDDFKEKRRYWNMKEETLDRTRWKTRFAGYSGPAARQTTEINKYMNNSSCICCFNDAGNISGYIAP